MWAGMRRSDTGQGQPGRRAGASVSNAGLSALAVVDSPGEKKKERGRERKTCCSSSKTAQRDILRSLTEREGERGVYAVAAARK